MLQDYNACRSTGHHTWSLLHKRQLVSVEQFAYEKFLSGIGQLGFEENCIPNFNTVNEKLATLTGWKIYAVPGLIDNKFFFEQMIGKKFGATTWIRQPDQLDYLEEPDMFHDVFGHVPLLADPNICHYLFELARIANNFIHDEEVIEAIARIYWYTIEFGLVKESPNEKRCEKSNHNSVLKIYGAGILSSIAETAYVFSGKPKLTPFNIETIINTPYIPALIISTFLLLP